MIKWVVIEYDGYSSKKTREFFFSTEKEALAMYNERKNAAKFAGSKYMNYFGYPIKRE